jgi:hypothetical protein
LAADVGVLEVQFGGLEDLEGVGDVFPLELVDDLGEFLEGDEVEVVNCVLDALLLHQETQEEVRELLQLIALTVEHLRDRSLQELLLPPQFFLRLLLHAFLLPQVGLHCLVIHLVVLHLI